MNVDARRPTPTQTCVFKHIIAVNVGRADEQVVFLKCAIPTVAFPPPLNGVVCRAYPTSAPHSLLALLLPCPSCEVESQEYHV
jgi:hypothetical protein